MTYTSVIEKWQNIEDGKVEYNLKIYDGFLPHKNERTLKRLKCAYSGKNINDLIDKCKKDRIRYQHAPGKYVDHTTTLDYPAVQGSMLYSPVSPIQLSKFHKKMIESEE
ncbi:hypothetical protein HYS72_03420 [Candidatus Pacearchaeota archaeon]|nr:hypothetical protein [Candidatus Pacearchaeota archaeon]MBI2056932.1 hypothetical protein [Candidatus Pacearchaeota archaeon]